jgi:hypothetical protein
MVEEKVNVAEQIAEQTEVVNVADFAEQPSAPLQTRLQTRRERRALPLHWIAAVVALIFSTVALVVSLARTELTIGQGQLYVEDGSVNAMLGNLIESELSGHVHRDLGVRQINIRVEIHGEGETPARVSDITAADRVTAQVQFFVQESIADFARDAHAVLKIMLEQMERQGFVYDEIVFTAQNPFTHMTAALSGRFAQSVTAGDIAAITYYFGEIAVDN